MKWWVPLSVLLVAGCGASSPSPQAQQPKEAGLFTTLSNGSIGVQIGTDGMPRQLMFVASSLVNGGPDPLAAVPFPELVSPRLTESRNGVTNVKPVSFHVSTSWLKPESNGILLRVTDGKRTLDVEYTLHPTEPALKMMVRSVRGPGDISLRVMHFESPLKAVEVNGQAVAVQGTPMTVEDLGKNGSYERTFSLTGKAPAELPSRLRVPRVTIQGDEEAATALNGMMARLVSGYRSGASWGPFGLTDARYQGRAFWDLDVWVLPAMVFLDPETAKKAADWRISTLPQAKKNYDAWVKAGRPVSDKKKLADVRRDELSTMGEAKPGGALFAWESAMDGSELSTSPTRFEHHISGSVALGLRFASRAGVTSESDVMPVYQAAKTFYWARSYREGEFHNRIPMTVSPDEWHVADNDLYTNEVANWVHTHGQWSDPPYQSPTDGAFEGDEGKGYQQASALLVVWPLGSIADQKEIGKMYDRFVGKEAPQGPAMTKSLNALIAARLGRTEEAYKQWNDSWKLYTDDPALRFREKQKAGDGYFYTGAAGCVNAFLYGFLGFELTEHEPMNVAWKEETTGGWLSLKPQLPRSWSSVELNEIWINGRRRKVSVSAAGVTVSKGE